MTWWRSEPSCFSARSSTPTRRGSVSSWPATASPPSRRSRWATTSAGSRPTLRRLLADADAVIVSGGLGPTHDDVTREAIAAVMGVGLREDPAVAAVIRDLFASRGRTMPDNNLRQAQVPEGATVIPQTRGTAPGLICPVGDKVVYAVPGVPHEMRDMLERAVLPDLRARDPEPGVIASRVLRTWGESESGLNERLDDVVARLDASVIRRSRSWPAGGTGSRSGSRPRATDEQAAAVVLDRVGGRGPRPSSAPWCSAPTTSRWSRSCSTCFAAGPDPRHRRVGHRRAGRRPADGDPGRERRAPRGARRPTPAR